MARRTTWWPGRTGAVALVLTTALTLVAAPVNATTGKPREVGHEVSDERASAPSKLRNVHSHRHHYSTWRDAHSYRSPDNRYPSGGLLWAGRHAFFCQTEGQAHSDGEGGYSTWWALTDDQTGNRDVYVSVTAFRIAEPWRPIEGLPRC
ncbi:MAG TPA: hypothetical protein K8V84_14840 [Nocardiopsis listeri]|uniref:hypothetical protein n=1 Tax=Nocardiopsis listeri TaxID=53440 RepID=UPI001D438E2B|nr:hypothetical protein [Nocardiopsis listeri]HJE59763.1 hypothetical protein [Nocardiopsis listeri]